VTACQDFSPGDRPNIHRIDVNYSYLMTPLQLADANQGVDSLDERMSQSIYVYASAPRAIVKEVSFRYNGTNVPTSLSDLTVTKVVDKHYLNMSKKPI
jgi:hypothetical protein